MRGISRKVLEHRVKIMAGAYAAVLAVALWDEAVRRIVAWVFRL